MDYIKKDDVLKLLNRNSITQKITFSDGISIYDSVKNLPTADVVPKKEIANVLLKIAVHNNTFHPNSVGISSFITLKTFDAVLQNFINKYDQKNGGGA